LEIELNVYHYDHALVHSKFRFHALIFGGLKKYDASGMKTRCYRRKNYWQRIAVSFWKLSSIICWVLNHLEIHFQYLLQSTVLDFKRKSLFFSMSLRLLVRSLVVCQLFQNPFKSNPTFWSEIYRRSFSFQS
jgi:hypothetical protein